MTDPDRFDRLPADGGDGPHGSEPTRESVIKYWEDRFDVDREGFEDHTFWEKGAGSVWTVTEDAPDPIAVESLGLRLLRTGGEHWKPTTNAVQRFGDTATRNVIELDRDQAAWFVAGETISIDWDGDWGFLIASTDIGGTAAVLGVGLYTYGELASNVPKSRRMGLR